MEVRGYRERDCFISEKCKQPTGTHTHRLAFHESCVPAQIVRLHDIRILITTPLVIMYMYI